MTPRKFFFIMIGGLLVTLLLTLGGIYLADSYLGKQSATIGELKAKDELLSTELINAQKTVESLKQYSYLQAITAEILPDTKNQSEVILLINKIGVETGIDVLDFTFLGTDGKPTDKSQTEPLDGASSILVFPVEINFRATYNQLISWLSKAEQNQRKMQISDINIDVVAESPPLNVTMNINAYLEK